MNELSFENNAQKIAIEAYKAVIKQQQQRIEELEKEVEYAEWLKSEIGSIMDLDIMEELYVLEHDTEPPKRKELSDARND